MMEHPRVKVIRFALLLATIFSSLPGWALANPDTPAIKLGENTVVLFATVEEGQKILTSRDDFVERLSPFDRAARLKTDQTVSEKKYLAFVGEQVLAWNGAEKQKLSTAFQEIVKKLAAYSLPFPDKVYLIKTTGKEEGNAPYTRANAVIIPESHLNKSAADIQHTICHELFHVMSRENPDLRDKLYAAIGFEKCDEVAFPSKLKLQKLTNPDAPKNDHCIRVQVKGGKYADKDQWAIPILFSNRKKYDVKRGGEFFNYLQFKLLLVERGENSSVVKPIYRDNKPELVDMRQVSGFFEQVGNNTQYIIHPEEILADNFAMLVLQKRDVPSPQIIEKLKELLK